ncbi:hypothetical protein HBI47_167180 [Parastagonospora nodorum]|nr:hypothetical protein HBI47_167180 [Parastagonospora nodorum]
MVQFDIAADRLDVKSRLEDDSYVCRLELGAPRYLKSTEMDLIVRRPIYFYFTQMHKHPTRSCSTIANPDAGVGRKPRFEVPARTHCHAIPLIWGPGAPNNSICFRVAAFHDFWFSCWPQRSWL